MSEITPDYTLDVKGETCPYPAIKMLEAMEELQKGEILEVLGDCPQSINNIQFDCKNHGYEVLLVEQLGPNLRFLIRK